MKIITLMENTTDHPDLKAQHGLSFYIESGDHKIILDSGASDLTWQNARILRVPVSEVDSLVLSHGHYDHCGGVLSFADMNDRASIYMRKTALEGYYHVKGDEARYIGVDEAIRDLPGLRLIDHEDIYQIDKNIELYGNITGRKLWPSGNLQLKKKVGEAYVQDRFDHEQCLVIKEDGKLVLLSGCAHNGILNILDRFQALYDRDPDLMISGFHMSRKGEYSPKDLEDIRETARCLAGRKTLFYTGHCTGQIAFDLMKEIMGDQLCYASAGSEIFF